VAAFDVDGTLTTRDCVVPFLRRIAGTAGLAAGLAKRPADLVRGAARRDRDLLKSLAAMAAFAGRGEAEVAEEGAEFAADVAAERLRSDTLETLRSHREAEDTVVLVSASFEMYLRPLATLIGADDVLGARLAAEGGVLTGELDGPNCRGPEKVRRLHGWLDEHAGGRDAVELIAYGDSAGDRELLADADTAHWVGTYRP
jgi:phosphatidylglycerophosphatase C